MATFSGKDGKVHDGGGAIADITRWTFSKSSNNHAYGSSSSGGHKARVAGVKDGNGTIEGKMQAGALPPVEEGDSVTLQLYEDGNAAGSTPYWSVPAIIGNVEIEVDIDDGAPVSWTAEFETNGAWTGPNYGS